jgi:lipopolysaccharide/colanic/teichoic acid biosynthesis glycosyltransferase
LRIPKLIPYDPFIKRSLDILVSSAALLFLSPLFYLIIFIIKSGSPGPVFFKQKRIGKGFRPFKLIKFRSMAVTENLGDGDFDPGDNSRVTKVGSFLRRSKLDELPELFNVLTGDMSIVGPRPEVEKYVKTHQKDFERTLRIRPGLSDFASIKYHDEEAILAGQADPERYYREVILPDKLRLAKRYVEEMSFRTDLKIIKHTINSVVTRGKQSRNRKE